MIMIINLLIILIPIDSYPCISLSFHILPLNTLISFDTLTDNILMNLSQIKTPYYTIDYNSYLKTTTVSLSFAIHSASSYEQSKSLPIKGHGTLFH